MLTVHQMHALVEIAKAGSIARAAINMNTGQAALSRTLRQVEDTVAAQLFHRTGRGVVLTEAGREVVDCCRDVIERFGRLRLSLDELSETPRGSLTIAMPTSVARVVMVPLITTCREHLPEADIRVIELFTGDVLEAVADGRVDVGVIYETPRASGANSDAVVLDDLFLVSAPERICAGRDEIPLRDVAKTRLLLPTRAQGVRGLFDREMARAGLVPTIHMEVDATVSLLDLVREDVGAALFSYSLVHREVERGVLAAARIVEPLLTREVLVVTATRRPLTTTARAGARLLRRLLLDGVSVARWRRPTDMP